MICLMYLKKDIMRSYILLKEKNPQILQDKNSFNERKCKSFTGEKTLNLQGSENPGRICCVFPVILSHSVFLNLCKGFNMC